MLDTIRLQTSLTPDPELLAKAIKRPTTKWECNVEHYRTRYTITEDNRTFKLYLHKSSAKPKLLNGICHAIEVNAHDFTSFQDLEEFLFNWFLDYEQIFFHVSRLDFCVDVELPFPWVLKAVHRERIRSFQIISHDKGRPSSIILGKNPVVAKIYDKSLEQRSKKIKNLSRKGFKVLPIGTTRFEIKMLKKGNKHFPIKALSEVHKLLHYGPFNLFKFKAISIFPPRSRVTAEQRKILDQVLHEDQFSSMQETIMYARSEFNIRKQQYPSYFEELGIADLNIAHQEGLLKWLKDSGPFQEAVNG